MIRCQLSFFFFFYLERHPHVGIDVSNIFPCQLPLLVHLKIKTIRICFSGEFPKKNNYPLSFQPSLPFQPSTHCLQSVRTTTNPLALLCSIGQTDEECSLGWSWNHLLISTHSSLLLPCSKLSEEAMLNSILIIAFEPSLGKAVILDLPLEQPVHPLPLEPGAVHLRSDQDTDAVQDAVLELTLPRRNQLITQSFPPGRCPCSHR